jgi:hypothetical protein
MEAAKLWEGMKVDILDVNNGERFQTYVIKGKRGNGDICLNGAAARKVAVGDKVNNNIFGAAGGRVPKLEEVDAYEENTQYTLSLKVTPKDITYSATGRLMFGTATYTDGEVAYFDLVGNKNCNVEPNTLVFFTTAPNKTAIK